MRGWGPNASEKMPIMATWSLTIQDTKGRTSTLDLDVTNDDTPVTVRMDKKFCITHNISRPSKMIINRPRYTKPRFLHTYITSTSRYGNRLSLDVDGIQKSSAAMLGQSSDRRQMRPMTLAKRIRNVTHASSEQAVKICKDAGWHTKELEEAIETVKKNCMTCVKAGRPTLARKLSLNQVNQHFNDEIQSDFTFFKIR